MMQTAGVSRDVNGHGFIGFATAAGWRCVFCGEIVPLNGRAVCAASTDALAEAVRS